MQSQKYIYIYILYNNLTHLLDTFTTQNLNTTAKKQGSTMLSHLNLPFSLFKKSPRLIPRNVSGSAWHVATSWWRRNTVAPVDVDGQRDLAGPRGSRWKDGMMIRSLFFYVYLICYFLSKPKTKVPLFEKNKTWLLLKWAPLKWTFFWVCKLILHRLPHDSDAGRLCSFDQLWLRSCREWMQSRNSCKHPSAYNLISMAYVF